MPRAASKRTLAKRIAHAEAMSSLYLGNYNEELAVGRAEMRREYAREVATLARQGQ